MGRFADYSLHLYTDVLFGLGTEKQVGRLVKKHGGTKVMLVYGGGSVKKSGLFAAVTSALADEGIPVVELAGVEPNPRRSLVDKGVALAKAEGVDFVLAAGGGSVIDTAKGIAYGIKYDGDFWDFYCGKAVPEFTVPVGVIPTIAAAGSETSISSVIYDDIGSKKKLASNQPINRPVFAIMNPALTYSVSPYQTAAGVSDILAHTVERYFMNCDSDLGDELAEGLMRTTVKYGPIAVRRPNDEAARREIMLCGSFSHNDITNVGRSGLRGGPHGLESGVSAAYDTAHGAGLAVLMPSWMAWLAEKGTPEMCGRVAQFAVEVFAVEPDMQDIKNVAKEGLRRFRAWETGMGMPKNLPELGVPSQDLDALVAGCRCDNNGILQGYAALTKDDVRWIFQNAMEA